VIKRRDTVCRSVCERWCRWCIRWRKWNSCWELAAVKQQSEHSTAGCWNTQLTTVKSWLQAALVD